MLHGSGFWRGDVGCGGREGKFGVKAGTRFGGRILRPLTWARARGYREQDEHIVIAGIPVQVIPAHNALAVEAVNSAASLEYEGESIRVIGPEYLIAMYLEETARTRKRLERVATLLDEGNLDEGLLEDLLDRYQLQLPQR